MKKPKSQGRTNRRRGHGFEREVAILLRPLFPEARRQLEYHQLDCNGVDIQNTGHYRIQCKRGRKWASLSAIEEIQCDEEISGHVPILVTKGDDKRILVAMPFEEFLRLVRI